ncbi:ATPase [bacterium (Candidatus Gribaldobacteria) CG10_big_fil_rev_8_21_14_0_10_37_21]|uniref:ATPase n=2 Tax=Candidatus Gribaldobacteria TaxID=2798536 RepID=A0A2H0UV23_9BACT|nr:MAG: ATPase [Parcubacteria group bacterium CG1_02_37_13]PIR90667.1 MAG: ATPase [bacterium (Candidatus Gribaldobacteria) CG10_big_fil_rev_8_21_14_0_10_37_21]
MIKRTLFNELKNHLNKKEITFIVGARQAGKTTLMVLLRDFLEKQGEKTVSLNLDIERDKQFFVSQEILIKKIELEIGKSKGYIFLDEIQRKENAGLFLKGIYDMNLPYKFIVSGSGSLELKEKIHESLAGRKIMFELQTLSFNEFANFKTNYQYENNLPDFFTIDQIQTEQLLAEYLNCGGYPKVILDDQLSEKKKTIEEIYRAYLERDISYLLGVQKTEVFTNLVKIIASQIGGLVNFTELSSTLRISAKTIKNYLWYLEKTFVLKRVDPFFRNIRKEISKAPVYYFNDLGLKNYALNEFGNALNFQNAGFLFENFVYKLIQEQTQDSSAKINFWRTTDKAEVDFVLNFGKEIVPIEAKYSHLKEPTLTRSLRGFIEKYRPKRVFVVNLSLNQKIKIDGSEINFTPFYLLKT